MTYFVSSEMYKTLTQSIKPVKKLIQLYPEAFLWGLPNPE